MLPQYVPNPNSYLGATLKIRERSMKVLRDEQFFLVDNNLASSRGIAPHSFLKIFVISVPVPIIQPVALHFPADTFINFLKLRNV